MKLYGHEDENDIKYVYQKADALKTKTMLLYFDRSIRNILNNHAIIKILSYQRENLLHMY